MVTPARGVTPGRASVIDAPGTDELTWRAWPELARLPVADVTGWTSAVIVAAHPDDEVLGAGGLLSLLAAGGARLRLIAVTDGEASHPGIAEPAALAERRVAETTAALRLLGAGRADVVRLRLPDTGLAAREDEIAFLLQHLVPGFDVCLAPWEKDAHADHEAAGRAARRASPQTIFYPVWTWHWAVSGDPRVPWRDALSVPLPPAVAARKRAAINCFASQLEPRAAQTGPVLSAATIAHFTRDREVLFR
jgi:LmbE family N-acetylglucosaminyl deacetylase